MAAEWEQIDDGQLGHLDGHGPRGEPVTYHLTAAGGELMASLQPLVNWGLRWHAIA